MAKRARVEGSGASCNDQAISDTRVPPAAATQPEGGPPQPISRRPTSVFEKIKKAVGVGKGPLRVNATTSAIGAVAVTTSKEQQALPVTAPVDESIETPSTVRSKSSKPPGRLQVPPNSASISMKPNVVGSVADDRLKTSAYALEGNSPIMASPTHAPISFLNIAAPARLKYAAAQSVFDDHDHNPCPSQTGGVRFRPAPRRAATRKYRGAPPRSGRRASVRA